MSDRFNIRDPSQPATENQKRALRKFNCDLPPNLNKGQASEWMDWVMTRVRLGKELTDLDRSGPPSFQKASEAPPAPPPAPKSPPSVTQAPVQPSGPPPAPPAPTSAPVPADESLLPPSDAWIVVEHERVLDPAQQTISTRTSVRLSSHPSLGETWVQSIERLRRIAQAEASAK